MGCDNLSSVAVGATVTCTPCPSGRGGVGACTGRKAKGQRKPFYRWVLSTPRSPLPVSTGIRRGFKMQRFSRLFWFTAIAGTLSSLLFFLAALRSFTTQADGMDALCRQGKPECSLESLQHLYHVACTAHVTGTLLSFGLAYIIGRGFIKPAATDAAA